MSAFHETFWTVVAGSAPVLMLAAAVNAQQLGRRVSALIDLEQRLRPPNAAGPKIEHDGSPESRLHARLNREYRLNAGAALVSVLIFAVALIDLAERTDTIALPVVAIALALVALGLVAVMLQEFATARAFSQIHVPMPGE